MKLNEMLSGDIGNLIFVLQILSILEEFSVFFFLRSSKLRGANILNDGDFSAFFWTSYAWQGAKSLMILWL